MSDELEKAEQFKRLFIDPAVEAMCERIDSHIAPLVKAQEEQAKKIEGHDQEIAALKSTNKKAMLGWGVFSAGFATVIGSVYGWAKSRFHWG